MGVREGGEGESRGLGRTTQIVGGIFKDGMLVSVGHCVLLINSNPMTRLYFGTFVAIIFDVVLSYFN